MHARQRLAPATSRTLYKIIETYLKRWHPTKESTVASPLTRKSLYRPARNCSEMRHMIVKRTRQNLRNSFLSFLKWNYEVVISRISECCYKKKRKRKICRPFYLKTTGFKIQYVKERRVRATIHFVAVARKSMEKGNENHIRRNSASRYWNRK